MTGIDFATYKLYAQAAARQLAADLDAATCTMDIIAADCSYDVRMSNAWLAACPPAHVTEHAAALALAAGEEVPA